MMMNSKQRTLSKLSPKLNIAEIKEEITGRTTESSTRRRLIRNNNNSISKPSIIVNSKSRLDTVNS